MLVAPGVTENVVKRVLTPLLLLLARATLRLARTDGEGGGKNLTPPQVRYAADASFTAARLRPAARRDYLDRVARHLLRVQHRNAKARRCHRRRCLRQLHRLGIHCRCCIPPRE